MLGGKNKSNRRVSLVNLRFDNVLFRISCLSICFLGVQISWSVAPLGRELLGFNLNAYSLFELYYDIINAKGCTCFLLAILWFTWIAWKCKGIEKILTYYGNCLYSFTFKKKELLPRKNEKVALWSHFCVSVAEDKKKKKREWVMWFVSYSIRLFKKPTLYISLKRVHVYMFHKNEGIFVYSFILIQGL